MTCANRFILVLQLHVVIELSFGFESGLVHLNDLIKAIIEISDADLCVTTISLQILLNFRFSIGP